MKLNNGLKFAGLGMALAVIVGCASIGGMSQKYVNNNKVEGIIYGVGLSDKSETDIDAICKSIENKDERCNHKDDYKIVGVAAKFGFADAFTGIIAFAPKSMDIGETCVTGSSKCTYLKTKVEMNKLGTVLEVASRPGDGKCHWSGMPRAGGTVCPAYNYDYAKDFAGIPR